MNSTSTVLVSRHYWIVTAAFSLFVLYGSLVPLRTHSRSWSDATEAYAKEMAKGVRSTSKSDFAANIILFVPLGFLAAGAVAVDRRQPAVLLALIPAMAAFSAAIEFLQLWFPDRNTTINDVAAETLGGIFGLGIWFAFGQEFTNRVRSAWANLGPGDWALKALPAYLLFLVIVHGMPFDLTLSPWQIKKKYDHGREIDAAESGAPTIDVTPYPRQIFEKTLLNVAYFLPVGALLAQFPGRRWRRPESAGRILAVGLAIAAGIEAVQLIVLSAGTYASDIFCGGLLVLAGWWLALRPEPLSVQAWRIASVVWALALVLCYWAPYEFAPERFGERFSRGEWMPFADYYAGNYIAGFNRIINKTVVFAPLGFTLVRSLSSLSTPRSESRRASNPQLWIAAFVVGGSLSAIIEVGQSLFNDHRSSLSDVILGGVGVSLGALLASRVARIGGTRQ